MSLTQQTKNNSHFSFVASPDFAIGPVENPIPPGQNVPNIGYNHCSAVVAFGEATMLAGWTTKGFAVHWASHFKLHKQPDQQYPPVLSEFICCCWPDVAIQATTIHSTDPDEEEPDQQITYPKCTDGVMLKDGVL